MAFLDAFDKAETKQITEAGTSLTVPEGWSPITQSTGADKLYIIESGEVAVRRNGEQINTLGAGDVMGEKAILGHTLRTASLVALTRLEVIHLTDEAVRKLCDKMPKFKDELEKAAAAHSRELTPEG
jgi:CRP/FNR family transcriptional regulator, cyclic AMP receptor protein